MYEFTPKQNSWSKDYKIFLHFAVKREINRLNDEMKSIDHTRN